MTLSLMINKKKKKKRIGSLSNVFPRTRAAPDGPFYFENADSFDVLISSARRGSVDKWYLLMKKGKQCETVRERERERERERGGV
jgi:hypothetical protein